MSNENVLMVTKEKVTEAAKQCPDAKKVLETLFPEAFKQPDTRVILPIGCGIVQYKHPQIGCTQFVERRAHGTLEGSLFLNPTYHWTIEKDGYGYECLVARPKGVNKC